MSGETQLDDAPAARRQEIVEEIMALTGEYARSFEGFEDAYVSAVYTIGEIVLVAGKTRIEISDPQSSRFTNMGLLFAALYDPRWLDPER